MAFTQEDADKLRRAIASGALTVRYQDRTVTYRSLAEMRETLGMIEEELSGQRKARRFKVGTTKGFR